MTLRALLRGVAPILILMFVGLSFNEAEARAGRGRSFGSRGAGSYRPPARPGPAYSSSNPLQSPSSGRSQPFGMGQSGGFLRGLAGGVLGGLVGGMLFRSLGLAAPAGGGGGGVGLFEVALLAGGAYLLYRFIAGRRRMAPAAAKPWTTDLRTPRTEAFAPPPYGFEPYGPPPYGLSDELRGGLSRIRQTDPSFREEQFTDTAQDIFFRVQGAWTRRDLSSVEASLGEGVRRTLQADVDDLKRRGQVNRLENIAVREVEIVEASQDEGEERLTVRLLANLLDFTTDEVGRVQSGSDCEPVKFEEYWTFTRPVGGGPWKLSAIQQA